MTYLNKKETKKDPKYWQLHKAKIIACNLWNIPVEDLNKETRKTEYVHARCFVMYYSYTVMDKTFKEAGEEVGKDHATCLRALRRTIPDRYATDIGFREKMDSFCKFLKTETPEIRVLK